VSPRKELTEAA